MENVNTDIQFQIPSSVGGPGTQPSVDMAADDQPEDAGTEPSHKVAPSKTARKRTKTGCLTCRQRRIKCGEEKPICNNCTKSKRECKGYAQRLVFKNPLGIPGIPGSFPIYNEPVRTLPLPRRFDRHADSQQALTDSRGPILAPRPPVAAAGEQSVFPQTSPGSHEGSEEFEQNLTQTSQLWNTEPLAASGPPEPSSSLHGQPPISTNRFNIDSSYYTQETQGSIRHESDNWVTQISTSSSAYFPDAPQTFQHEPQSTYQLPSQGLVTPSSPEKQQTDYIQRQSVPFENSPHFEYVDDDGDDYYDVESDEEAEYQVSLQNFNQLSLIMDSANRDEQQIRSFTTYLNEPNVLASYHPTFGSSPLNNPKTARIFLHFIHATGPSLSIFERHPIDPSTMLGTPVPMAQQGLWTYTMPLKAFEHQALLQAILAISSLHISFLQQSPITISLKHYHYALKRLGKAVGLPMRRRQVGTLAATLLLSFYEVMTADHSKWGSHLAGSALLLREIDYPGLTRDLRSQRRNRWIERQQRSKLNKLPTEDYILHSATSCDDPFADFESGVDETVVGYITGRAINYDNFGQVEVGHGNPQPGRLSRKDIERFQIQCDLFWFFCKQDFMQSIVSGNALLLPYSQWLQCPPRATLGRVDAIYGSSDHLSLLMGRIADFAHRDKERKLREGKSTGSEWKPDSRLFKFMARFAGQRPESQRKPHPEMPFGPPNGTPAANDWSPQSTKDSRKGSQVSSGSTSMESQQSPITTPSPGRGTSPMYGMVPPTGPRKLPPSFATHSYASVDTYDNDEEEDGVSYEDAESEWESILAAFDMFGPALGPDFMPLPPDSVLPIASAFGPALQYRTHNIAALWAIYYCGRILLHRVHPSMPPAMMVAAGVAAPTTAEYSGVIGRIAAGIYCPQSVNSRTDGLSPTLGSCLVEISVPIFIAGVQYMDAAQRSWTITVLNDISRLTGWKSSDAIAKGCERAWIMAAKQGRGPPYQRPPEGATHQAPDWIPTISPEVVDNRFQNISERRFVTVRKAPYISWAMGVLSLEDHIY